MSFFRGLRNMYRAAQQMSAFEQKDSAAPYRGAGHGRPLRNWNAPGVGPNAALRQGADGLRRRSRDLVRNDRWGAAMQGRFTTNMVGTGIKPRSEAPDEESRKAIQAEWLRWTDHADADQVLDFYGLQQLISNEFWEAGEVFPRLRFNPRGDQVPLQIQIIESEQVPMEYNAIAANGNQIRAGIERNARGDRTRYWVYNAHPGDYMSLGLAMHPLEKMPVSADEMMHVYQPMRAGQLRGLPTVTPILAKMYEMQQFDDSTMMRQWAASLFAGFLEKPSTATSALNPLTGQPRDQDTDYDTTDIAALEAGTISEMPPGWEMKWSDPPDSGNVYGDFMRYQVTAAAAAVGMDYATLTGDLRGVNDRLLRALLQEFRRRISMVQHNNMVFQFCRPVWERWMDTAVLAGRLVLPDYENRRAEYLKVRWVPEAWPYLHPVQDIQANKDAVRSGFKSRSQVVNERGDDTEELDREIKADQDRADASGLSFDTDGRHGGTGGRASATPSTAEPEDETSNAEDAD